MNKVILMGRLSIDPEIRYSQSSEPIAIARYNIAVNKSFKREGESDADFIPCVAFGKKAEFVERFLKKGMMIAISGRLSVRHYEDQQNQKKVFTEVIVDDHYFAESKSAFESRMSASKSQPKQSENNNQSSNTKSFSENELPNEFFPIDDNVDDDDLPF